MILGEVCTRRCSFCDVAHGRPRPPDASEPVNLGSTVAVVCDGAKTGCALKVGGLIGQGVNSALLALNGCAIKPTDGIVNLLAENTMREMGELSSNGLSSMDPTILGIMLAKRAG